MNHLAQEKSPYLQQHKNNPVAWYSWCDEAFVEAKQRNVPVFVSIGYSTCYWCHVMEKESFESKEVAEFLNKHFVSIKVDREERPDVDGVYMDAVVALQGQGGWPLSVFLSPDRRPFFGGTYFPRDQFLVLLDRVRTVWSESESVVLESADKVCSVLLQGVVQPKEECGDFEGLLRDAYTELCSAFDAERGGFGQAPKFPHATQISLLLRLGRRAVKSEACSMAYRCLDAMALGGIYDHLGGGFHRYSTDQEWTVPHFEKMLYDNALLIQSYTEAFQCSGAQHYRDVVYETIEFMRRELRSPEGGFFSAQDAGEVGKEGEFYVWKRDQLEAALPASQRQRWFEVFSSPKEGNFEHGALILRLKNLEDWKESRSEDFTQTRQELLKKRSTRPAPHRDGKILTDWNALAISALVAAWKVFAESEFLKLATDCAEFLTKSLIEASGKLYHRYCDGERKVSGLLDDYAFLIRALLDLFEATGDSKWFEKATMLQEAQDNLFWDEKSGGYFITPVNNSELPIKKKSFRDGAEPSGNAMAAWNLVRLSLFTCDDVCRHRALKLIASAGELDKQFPSSFATLLYAVDMLDDRAKQVVIGDEAFFRSSVHELWKVYQPNSAFVLNSKTIKKLFSKLLQGKMAEEKKIYVCEHGLCQLPVTSTEEAIKLLLTYKPLTVAT